MSPFPVTDVTFSGHWFVPFSGSNVDDGRDVAGYSATYMNEATAAFLGVIAGGAISVGSQWVFELRRGWAEERELARRATADLRTACRLILSEFSSALASVSLCLKDRRWGGNPSFPLFHWATYAPRLAEQLSDADWSVISIGFHSIEAMSEAYRDHATFSPSGVMMTDDEVELVVQLQRQIQNAITALTTYVRTK